mgnify:CR=1 FL=1
MAVENKGMLDFSSLKYERPDVDHFKQVVQSTRLKLMSARDPEIAFAALLEYEKELSMLMYSLEDAGHQIIQEHHM